MNNAPDQETINLITKSYANHCIEQNTYSNTLKVADLYTQINLNVFEIYELLMSKKYFHAAAIFVLKKL